MEIHHPLYNKKSLSVVLLGAAVVAFVLMLIKITSFLEASARAQNIVKNAAVQDERIPEKAGQTAQASWVVAEQLKKNNLFSPPSPPRHPVTSVLGILGNEVLIAEKWYKAGDTIEDAEIISVEPTHIRVQWQGRETVFAPIEMSIQPASPGSRPAQRDIGQSGRTAAPAPRGTPSSRTGQAELVRIPPRTERISGQSKTKLNAEADKKRQFSNEKQQYQKALKQNLKVPKSETATNKSSTDAVARKKSAATDAKKSARKLSQ
ncbi:MAG TPA: hypothetical protein VMW24_17645 [Sedimentisphaerales bacterium]|nr:hypothetical protein [Sedimentisphaerales bacterium]